VSPVKKDGKQVRRGQPPGFSLLEMMVTLVILLGVTGIVMGAMTQMLKTQGTVANRTEMHSSVRSATEVLQQEIGQAGKVSLPGSTPVFLISAVTTLGTPVYVSVSSADGMFNGEQLTIDTGDNQETVRITNLYWGSNTFSATFNRTTHAIGAPVTVSGGFASGVVPKSATNGSGDFLMKLYGDINDDGNMEYVEYKCDTTGGNLYRNVVTIVPGATKPSVDSSMVILSNIISNPPDPGTTGPAPCFKYQEMTVGADTYVVDVSVTLTVQTQNKDPQTHQFQTETKALLNVSPRNVFEVWQLASGGVANRVQPMPATVVSLLQ
jgi:prepilin-type N-terminal cleavage/methylation domain-containing protein